MLQKRIEVTSRWKTSIYVGLIWMLQYYIWINDEFKENATIEGFYNKLCLGSELHRIDYLIMNIIGLQRYCEDNSNLYVGLRKILDIIRQKRNIM